MVKKVRKKMGRPRTVPDSLRTARRILHLCPEEAVVVDKIVNKSGKSFSSWAREVLLEIVAR